jgi:hypothetical protein
MFIIRLLSARGFIFDKFTVAHLPKKHPNIYGTGKLITTKKNQ